MNHVYGDTLAFFPELMEPYTVYRMKALPGGAGYGERTNERQVDGVVQWAPGGKMGIMGGNREPNAVGSFWFNIDDDGDIIQGEFIDAGRRGTFILTNDKSYAQTGGYMKMIMNIVPALTDRQTTNQKVTPQNDYQ